MITQEQFEQLPEELAQIVDLDRKIGNAKRRDPVDFAEFRALTEIRADWRHVADRIWGYTARTTADGAHA